MDLSQFVGGAELIGAAAAFLLLVYRQARTGARDAWREVAESQTARADGLAAQVESLCTEVRILRTENEKLRVEVSELRAENRELREHIDNLIGGSA
ncbi:hypothetical protein TG1_17 [Streptomyces phage TG1]|uniref:Uncharacterized protein n=1 Tax=Streptomyces phage TG1 TaxID=2927987 RepID=K4I0A7_9CAUD|nr:hypothetical protein D281_gp17 [Streptomyces phage TG1]AFU62212.1 hypothetical protein TG1_17 [Streptomyces phage TG1]